MNRKQRVISLILLVRILIGCGCGNQTRIPKASADSIYAEEANWVYAAICQVNEHRTI